MPLSVQRPIGPKQFDVAIEIFLAPTIILNTIKLGDKELFVHRKIVP